MFFNLKKTFKQKENTHLLINNKNKPNNKIYVCSQ